MREEYNRMDGVLLRLRKDGHFPVFSGNDQMVTSASNR